MPCWCPAHHGCWCGNRSEPDRGLLELELAPDELLAGSNCEGTLCQSLLKWMWVPTKLRRCWPELAKLRSRRDREGIFLCRRLFLRTSIEVSSLMPITGSASFSSRSWRIELWKKNVVYPCWRSHCLWWLLFAQFSMWKLVLLPCVYIDDE